jgi:hypothetical protein
VLFFPGTGLALLYVNWFFCNALSIFLKPHERSVALLELIHSNMTRAVETANIIKNHLPSVPVRPVSLCYFSYWLKRDALHLYCVR